MIIDLRQVYQFSSCQICISFISNAHQYTHMRHSPVFVIYSTVLIPTPLIIPVEGFHFPDLMQ